MRGGGGGLCIIVVPYILVCGYGVSCVFVFGVLEPKVGTMVGSCLCDSLPTSLCAYRCLATRVFEAVISPGGVGSVLEEADKK